MGIKEFIEKFANAVEVEDTDLLTPDTVIRDLDEWGSIAYLSVIAMLDEEFGIQIEMSDFDRLKTIQDIFDKAKSLQ